MMTALLAVPLIGAAGMAVDVNYAFEQKEMLMKAADAAAVGALAEKSAGVAAALAMTSDGAVDVADADAKTLFLAQVPEEMRDRILSTNISILRTGNEMTSQLNFEARVPTSFMNIFGKDSVTVSGSATASYQTNAFVDFYMLLDNTPSMGLAATQAGITLMEKNTGDDPCAFACHATADADQNTYLIAKNLGVKMRIDVVREATQALTHDATEYMRVTNQYRMAVYTFGATADTAGLTEIIAMNSDMAKVRTATDAVDLMTTKKNNYLANQLTDFNAALTSMKTKIGTGGAGYSSTDRQKVLFFVSDGVADYQTTNCTRSMPEKQPTRCQEPLQPSYCKAIKDKGVKIAVLYTTYLDLPDDSWWKNWIKPFSSQIPTNMEACASPGYYFEVSPSEGITEAMQALFRKVISAPRLTG
ncbi:pilus assembly protein TadG-related protein [Rhizobium sp. SL86]|uniref:pilus assembly protein TadG-related protein n=1 Tax=Rhizobium sp. SL86 TaxID=2995148 RepID=UPI0022754EC1|nr:pilus assembly protein TadG-related protein [Rhizobium sp. SL86]MCY1668885.1 pilus assembly protein TadG-related protein [Rhizobium sp. SL86]